jgi:hypothetical protein
MYIRTDLCSNNYLKGEYIIMKETRAPNSSLGEFVDENIALGIAGTEISAEDLNAHQNEILNTIDALGIARNYTDLTLLKKAIGLQSVIGQFYEDSGIANEYILTKSANSISMSELRRGTLIYFIPLHNNTGAATVNVADFGVKNIKKNNILSSVYNLLDITANDINVNKLNILFYDGTEFILLNPITNDNIIYNAIHTVENNFDMYYMGFDITEEQLINGFKLRFITSINSTTYQSYIKLRSGRTVLLFREAGYKALAGDIRKWMINTVEYDDTINYFIVKGTLANLGNLTSNDYYTDNGSANIYLLTPIFTPLLDPPVYYTGMKIRFLTNNANTGAATVNVKVNGTAIGAKSLKKADGITDISVGDILPNILIKIWYDGTVFRLE